MASTIDIVCPHCTKSMKGPSSLQGKKIRCKSCGETFQVPGEAAQSETFGLADEPAPPKKSIQAKRPGEPAAKPAGKKPAPAAEPAKPKPKPKPAADEDEEGGNYGLTETYLGARCPHCAAEMEEGDRICLNCGYDTVARKRHGSKKTFETTGNDVALWLTPGIICVVVALFCLISDIVFVAFQLSLQKYVYEDTFGWSPPEANAKYTYFNPCSFWTVVISFFIIVPCVRFAIKRLIFQTTPPEVEKH